MVGRIHYLLNMDEFLCVPHNNPIIHLGMDFDQLRDEELPRNPVMRKERRLSPLPHLQLIDESDENNPTNTAFHYSKEAMIEWNM